jgi:hypothetical protein
VIEENGFHECRSLSAVSFETESRLERIGANGFSLSGLKSITIPLGVKVIEAECFSMCKSLDEVIFEGKVHEMGYAVFERSSLRVVRIPRGEQLNVGLPNGCQIEYFE